MLSAACASRCVTALLSLLCLLTAFDLLQQLQRSALAQGLGQYASVLRASDYLWHVGWRLEAVEERAAVQQQRLQQLRAASNIHWTAAIRGMLPNTEGERAREQRYKLHNTWFNDSRLYTITCENSFQTQRVQVGLNKFRSDPRDSCQLFFAATDDIKPNHVFAMHSLGDGAFALRSLSSSRFVQAVPPPPEGAWSQPWKLTVNSPSPGAAERFRISEEGFLYSALMQGFFQCSGMGEIVKGYPGEYTEKGRFALRALDDEEAKKAQLAKAISDRVLATQHAAIHEHVEKKQQQQQFRQAHARKDDEKGPAKIALTIPMTSRGTDMWDIRDSPFWDNVFPTFMNSIDWNSNTFVFCFYLGFDRGDPLYDTGDAWNEMREVFKSQVESALAFGVKESARENAVANQLKIKLMHFAGFEGAPSQVVNQLASQAVKDGYDYIYQINDDTTIVTPNWAAQLVGVLQSNPMYPNFGVTGPLDTNNEKIFTHCFVHKTHVEIFGGIFPTAFKNWWSDDWVSTVYGELHTFHLPSVVITHNVGAKKTSGTTRYEVDMNGQLALESELLRGYVRINRWLVRKQLPRLPLPSVCNYAPALHFAGDYLMEHAFQQS